MWKKPFIGLGIGAMLLCITYFLSPRQPKGCVLDLDKVTLGTVFAGKFVESVPFSARMTVDSTANLIIGELDQMYFSRVPEGLQALTYIDGADYKFVTTGKDSIRQDGRFQIALSSTDSAQQQIRLKEVLRMRLVLSEVENAVQLPVGGFYKDTGGKYVYVVQPDKKVVKRSVVLGKKNSEYFQVISGLVAGEVVITSSYENLEGRDDLDWQKVLDLNN